MNDDLFGELLLLLLLIGLNAFFAAAEIAIISVRKARLRQMLDDDVPGARLVHELAENASRLLATIQVGVTLAGFFAAATSAETLARGLGAALADAPYVGPYSYAISLFVVTSLLAFIMLVFGELVPKNLALQHSERVALNVARPLNVIATIFHPIVSMLSAVTDVLVRLLGGRQTNVMPFVTEDEIKTMVDAGEETGVLEESEKDMIYGVFGLGETLVREVMVPRVDMVTVHAHAGVRGAARAVLQSGHARVPVHEGTPDTIVGVLHVQDLLAALSDQTLPQDLRKLMRAPYYVPETKRVDSLLREMQSMSVHMAIVVDEYGGTAGLVTIEDLLEEIVGEIRDEHDREELPTERVDDNTMIFDGRETLDHVNEMLELELVEQDVDTLGGLVAARLEKVPARGDRLDVDGAVIEVVAAARRRAKRVKVTRRLPQEGGTSSQDG